MLCAFLIALEGTQKTRTDYYPFYFVETGRNRD